MKDACARTEIVILECHIRELDRQMGRQQDKMSVLMEHLGLEFHREPERLVVRKRRGAK